MGVLNHVPFGTVKNAAQLSRFSMTFAVRNFLKNVTRFGEKLVVLRTSFPCSGLVSEGADFEGLGSA